MTTLRGTDIFKVLILLNMKKVYYSSNKYYLRCIHTAKSAND